MIPNPILRVLSTFQKHEVRALLIGGQAAILYGGAEFSRDSDFVILVNRENLLRLEDALSDLNAEPVAFPELSEEALRRGHGVHFRCRDADVQGLRIDLLAQLRGCDPFEVLWERRSEVKLPDGRVLPVISLPDLVQSKKTQRDKDWLMLRRLVENDIRQHSGRPTPGQVRWWLLEARDPATLTDLAGRFPRLAQHAAQRRSTLRFAISGQLPELDQALGQEEQRERELDRAYWEPLRAEIEAMRRSRPR